MVREANIYRRLPGRGTTLTSFVRLYEGPDHLLQVSSTGYSENYRRFFYRDIQAVIVRRTSGGTTLSIAWTVPLLLFALLAVVFAANGVAEAAVVMLIIAALFLAGWISHLLLGPTCVCDIQTAVQRERLPTVRRVRSAQRFLQRLKGQIEIHQGPLSAEALASSLAEMWRATAFEATNPPVATHPPAESASPAESTRVAREPRPDGGDAAGAPPVAS